MPMLYRLALSRARLAGGRVGRENFTHNAHLARSLSSRASTVLTALDIPTSAAEPIPGVYDGQWTGSGEVLESVCPATGEILARVHGVGLVASTRSSAF